MTRRSSTTQHLSWTATATATADTVRSECSELTKRIDTTDDQAEALSEQMLAQIDALGVSIRMSEGRRAPSAAGAEAQDRPAELSSSAEVAELKQAVQLLQQQQPRAAPEARGVASCRDSLGGRRHELEGLDRVLRRV